MNRLMKAFFFSFVVIQFSMAQQPSESLIPFDAETSEQLKIEARKRAEAVAQEILKSESLPTTKKRISGTTAESYTKPALSPSTEHRTINVDETGMPVGWDKFHWLRIEDEDRSLILRLANLGLVSAAPEKPNWIFSDSAMNKYAGYIEEGKKGEPIFGLSMHYLVLQAGSVRNLQKTFNQYNREKPEAIKLYDYWMKGFTYTFRDYNDECKLRLAKQFMKIVPDVQLDDVIGHITSMERKALDGQKGKGVLCGWKILLEFKEKYPFLFL